MLVTQHGVLPGMAVMALEVAVAMFLWMKKKTHPERSAGKDVGLPTVNSNPMLEKMIGLGKI